MSRWTTRTVVVLALLLVMTAPHRADPEYALTGNSSSPPPPFEPPPLPDLVIDQFDVIPLPGNLYHFTGSVSGAPPEAVWVEIDGCIGWYVLLLDEDGRFEMTVELSPDVSGTVRAVAYTIIQESEPMYDLIE